MAVSITEAEQHGVSTSSQGSTLAQEALVGQAVKEAVWDFGIQTGAITNFSDSQDAINLLKHPIASVRSKHVRVIHHFVRDRLSRGSHRLIL